MTPDSASLKTVPMGVYKIVVQFSIDKEGKVDDVSVLEDPGYGLGKKAGNVISQYKDLWKPATLNGCEIKSFTRQPITFIVEEEEKCEGSVPGRLIP